MKRGSCTIKLKVDLEALLIPKSEGERENIGGGEEVRKITCGLPVKRGHLKEVERFAGS